MRRIGLAVVLALSLILAPLAAVAQQAGKPIRIGVLTPQSRAASAPVWDSFSELGWEEGKNVVTEYRFAEGQFDRLPVLAEELVKLNVNVIIAANSPGTRAAMAETKTIRRSSGHRVCHEPRSARRQRYWRIEHVARPNSEAAGAAQRSRPASVADRRDTESRRSHYVAPVA
jgi:hypothetical protein